MASNFVAPTSPDADNGVFRPTVLTQGARIDVRYTDMAADDFMWVRWGTSYTSPQQQGNPATGTVQFLVPAAEVVKTAGQAVSVTYTVLHPTGPSQSAAGQFTVPANATAVAITQVLDSNNVAIPNGGTTTSTRVTLYGTAS
jgi:hypothetical protein